MFFNCHLYIYLTIVKCTHRGFQTHEYGSRFLNKVSFPGLDSREITYWCFFLLVQLFLRNVTVWFLLLGKTSNQNPLMQHCGRNLYCCFFYEQSKSLWTMRTFLKRLWNHLMCSIFAVLSPLWHFKFVKLVWLHFPS